MPYIPPKNRAAIDAAVKDLVSTPGSLNYAISKLCHEYILNFGLNYATLNEVIGVLDCAKLELYSQVVRPYEGKKCKLNGHVSELDANNE